MAIKGDLVSVAAYTAFGPAVAANQATAQFGPLASPPTQAMDAFMCTATTTVAATLTDQNGVATVFAVGSFIAGQVYQLSPSAFTNVGGAGVFVPLYR
jgi:hypothetical protein